MHFESDGGIWKPGGSEKSIIGGGGIACADTLGATVRMASAIKPAVQSSENVSESFVRFTVPPLLLHMVRGAISVTLDSVPEGPGSPRRKLGEAKAWHRLQHTPRREIFNSKI